MHLRPRFTPWMGKTLICASLMSLVLLLTAGWTSTFGEPPERHPAAMDELVPIDGCGLRRAYKVCEGFYRGGRLSPEGAAYLKSIGVKTVISLRMVGNDECFIREAGLNYVHISFKVWRPNDEQVVQFLQVATDPNCQPVYVYCNRGAERTGMMSAIYRTVVCGWSREEALQEMTQGPFDYHSIYKKVRIYVENIDVESIRRQAGLAN